MCDLKFLCTHCTSTVNSPLWDCSNTDIYDKDSEFTDFINYYRNNLIKRSISFISSSGDCQNVLCMGCDFYFCNHQDISVLCLDGYA